jgi:hypothetical protein
MVAEEKVLSGMIVISSARQVVQYYCMQLCHFLFLDEKKVTKEKSRKEG